MHPAILPHRLETDPKRAAERSVYTALASAEDVEWEAYYSVAWHHKHRVKGCRDGEADFVIVHPRDGVLLLEVKGGGVSRDAANNWHSTDRHGVRHPIADPIEQLHRSKRALAEKLTSIPEWGFGIVQMGHAVVVPHCRVGELDLGPDLPRALVIDEGDLAQLSTRIDQVFAHWRGTTQGARPPDLEQRRLLHRLLSPAFELPLSTRAHVEASEEFFARPTDFQSYVLAAMNRQNRVSVKGFAGSGKTIVAAEQARRLAKDGIRTLLTCFNRGLAEDLRRRIGDQDNLEIYTFHHLCSTMAERTGVVLPSQPKGDAEALRRWYDEDHTAALDEAIRRQPTQRFEAIIVDEGQDFREHWWGCLERLLIDPGTGILHIFHDANQAIFHHQTSIPELDHSFELPHILRNTDQIYAAINSRYGPLPTCLAGEGAPVEWLRTTDDNHGDLIDEVVRRLIEENGFRPSQIAVLSGRALDRSTLKDKVTLGGHPVGGAFEPGEHVVVSSIHSFKGLESPIVILTELERVLVRGYEEVAYVGMSRARSLLVVIDKSEVLELLQTRR